MIVQMQLYKRTFLMMYWSGTVGNMLRMAVARAHTIVSTSVLHVESSPVKKEYTLSFTVKLSWLPRLLSNAWISR